MMLPSLRTHVLSFRTFRTSAILRFSDEALPENGTKKKPEKKMRQLQTRMGTSPLELQRENMGQYFNLASSAGDLKKLIPEGWSDELEEEFTLCTIPALQLRESFFEVKELLEQISKSPSSEDPDLLMLQGARGSGKSALMLSAVHWARSHPDWIALYMPNPASWLIGKKPIMHGTGTGAVVVPSKVRKGKYAQPLGAKSILESMLNLYADKLEKLPLRNTYPHTQYKDNLLSIVEKGIALPALAGDAVVDLRLELCQVEEYPVLIAVDEVNVFSWPTRFYSQGFPIAPDELLLNTAFNPIDSNGEIITGIKVKNGLFMCALTAKHGVPVPPVTIKNHSRILKKDFMVPFNTYGTELYLPAPEGLKIMDMQPYSLPEVTNAVIQYRRTKKLVISDNASLDNPYLEQLRAITGSNPRNIRHAMVFGSIL